MFNSPLPGKGRLQFFFDRSNYVVAPGGTVAVNVFVQETFHPRTDESLLAPGSDGLIRGGVFVQFNSEGAGQPTRVRSVADIAGNPHFDLACLPQLPGPSSPDAAGVLVLSQSPVFGEVVSRSAACETVLLPLGTFTFTAGKVLGESTFLTAVATEDYATMPGDTSVTSSGAVLDGLLQPGTAVITVSSKPPAPKSNGAATVADLIAAMDKEPKRRKW